MYLMPEHNFPMHNICTVSWMALGSYSDVKDWPIIVHLTRADAVADINKSIEGKFTPGTLDCSLRVLWVWWRTLTGWQEVAIGIFITTLESKLNESGPIWHLIACIILIVCVYYHSVTISLTSIFSQVYSYPLVEETDHEQGLGMSMREWVIFSFSSWLNWSHVGDILIHFLSN